MLSETLPAGRDTPLVHGKFSERVFVYTVAKALEALEEISAPFDYLDEQENTLTNETSWLCINTDGVAVALIVEVE